MATNPPSFFTPEAISRDTYTSGPVDFYRQALDTSTLEATGIDVVDPDDITELEEYGIAGEGGGDSQDDALNVLDATSIQGDFVGGSMFPGGTGIEYNNFDAYSTYDSYSDYLSAEKPPGMADRVGFISNVMEPLTSGRFGDINFSAGTAGLADRVGKDIVEGVTKPDAKTGIKTVLAATNPMLALAGSALFSTTTVTNAFGNTSARPDGILGMVADAVHSIQYADMAHNRAVARAYSSDLQDAIDDPDEDLYGSISEGRRDFGFAMSFGSGTGAGGITRRAGTGTYTGNTRGLDNNTLRSIEAVQRGFVPSTFGGTFGFDYTGKDAVRFEDAGYSGQLSGGGRYTDTGAYMDAYGRVSMLGRASDLKSLAKTEDITEIEAAKALSAARKGEGKLKDIISGIKSQKAAKSQAEADRATAQAAAEAKASRDRLAQIQQQQYSDSGRDDADSYGGSGVEDAGRGQAGGDFESGLSHAKGGKVQGYAMGTPPPGVQASQTGFVDRPPSQVSEAGKVADDRPMKAPEGMYVINAAAVEFAGEQDIRKMIMDAQKEAVRRGLSTDDFERHSNLVDIAVSSGEVTVAPHLVKIIGEDRLEKINKRGIRKTEQRIAENGQQPVQAARGGFLA
jgi:hypothetical protein